MNWGGRRDSNPQQPEPQSGALPVSYDHQLRAKSVISARRIAKGVSRLWHTLRYSAECVEGCIATGYPFGIVPARRRMRKIGSILVAGVFLIWPLTRVAAQAEDPSDIFLKAYMTAQQADKLEHENQFNAALAKYRAAGVLIEQLKKNYADWQPAIVEYRGRKISESILRVQDKAGTQSDLASAAAPPGEGPAPPSSKPAPQSSAVITGASTPQLANDAAIKEATKKLNEKIEQLQGELQKSRSQLQTAQKEKESLNGRLNDTTTKLTQAQSELEKSKTSERQVRDQLARAEESLKKIQSSGGPSTKAEAALRAEITRLKDALTPAGEERAAGGEKK